MKKLMIGGAALNELGSSRATQDMDYLVHIPGGDLFIKGDGGDLVNAAAHPFFGAGELSEIRKIIRGVKR